MDTIRLFIENMFYGISPSPKVEQAKIDLLAMMEDKYNELKAAGRTENEAVGQVISEFGNLEDLADDLGIQSEYSHGQQTEAKADTKSGAPAMVLDDMKVEQLLNNRKKITWRVMLGVILCILSPTVIVISGGYYEQRDIEMSAMQALPGIIFLFLAVAIAVYLFISTGPYSETWKQLEDHVALISHKKRSELNDVYEAERPAFARKIGLGVVLIFLGIIGIIVANSLFENNDFYSSIGVGVFLSLVSIANALFIHTLMRKGSLEMLLNRGEYTEQERVASAKTGVFAGPYWILVTAGYLSWSFISGNWGITWIIWPIAGVLFAAIHAAVSGIEKSKNS